MSFAEEKQEMLAVTDSGSSEWSRRIARIRTGAPENEHQHRSSSIEDLARCS